MGCPLSANSNNISSLIWLQAPCGLFFSIEYHFFSEPGPKVVTILARRFGIGYWSFIGPGSEKKWYSMEKNSPQGACNHIKDEMLLEFEESGHPISAQRLHCPGVSWKLSIHFTADQDTVDTIYRIILSVNQLSVYGAVAAFATHSSSLPFLSQEMSLNIDNREFFLWKFLMLICSVDHWLYRRAATLWILGRCSTRVGSALHSHRHNLYSFDQLWSIQSFASKLRWNPDVDGFSMAQQRIWEDVDSCALKIDNCFITNQGFPPGHSPTARWHRTSASMWDLHNSWWNFE